MKTDTSKSPKGYTWRKYFHEPISPGAIETYFDITTITPDAPSAIGVVMGAISGNLEAQDIDRADIYDPWCEVVEEMRPGLLDKLTLRVNTGGGGWHLPYRCSAIGPSQKLAQNKVGETEDGKPIVKTLVETRGIGSQIVAAGSPPWTHQSGLPYRVVLGSWEAIPVITLEEREVLLEAGRTFNRYTGPIEEKNPEEGDRSYDPEDLDLPGNDFSARGSWSFLEDHGYEIDHGDDVTTYWTRPGKTSGTSVTTGYQDLPILHCFSSSISEFEPGGTYSKFAVYAILAHGGDYSKAAKGLIELGYGKAGREQIHKAEQLRKYKEIFANREQDEEKQKEEQIASVPNDRDDPMFSYLWENNHSLLNDEDRARRIQTVKNTLHVVPKGFLADYIQYQLPASDCPVMYHLASSLAIMGHLMNRSVRLQFGSGYIYPNMWIGILGDSSVMHKSQAINRAKCLLSQMDEYEPTLLSDSFTFESFLAAIGQVIKPESDEEEKIDPRPAHIKAREACRRKEERCMDLDVPYTKGVGLFHLNEIGSWLATLSKNQNLSAKEIITELYDCPTDWRKETKTQGTYYVYRPCLSILGASTMEWLVNNSKESDLRGGFLPRWIYFPEKTKDYTLSIPDVPDPVREASLLGQMKRISSLRQDMTLKLGDEAFESYWYWRQQIEVEAVKKKDGIVLSWVNRLAIYCLKIAMIFEASSGSISDQISESSMVSAMRLTDYLLVALKSVLEDVTFDVDGANLAKVKRVIRDAGGKGILHSPAFRKSKITNARVFKGCIDTLLEQDVILLEEGQGTGKPFKKYFWKG